MAQIKITHDGRCGEIEVDGVPLKGVAGASVTLDARSMPTVEVRLIASYGALEFKECRLKVGALDAPEELERAVLAHLKTKYETHLMCTVSKDEMDAAQPTDNKTLADCMEKFGLWPNRVRNADRKIARPADPMDAVRDLCKGIGGGSGC
jgi:hypothetical protein